MQTRPKIAIELTPPDRFLELMSWVLLSILWILTIVFYSRLPDIIPTHFDALGQADDFGSKQTILILPVIATVLFLGLTILNRYPHIFNFPVEINESNAFRQYTNATRMIRVLKMTTTLIFIVIVVVILQTAQTGTADRNVWLLPSILGLVIIPLIYFLVRTIKMR